MGRARDLANILSSSGNVALDSELGLSLITPTSIAATGGSASISSTGAVSFTSASAISLNNAFSATYDNYRILWKGIASATVGVKLRLRAAGTDVTSGNYFYEELVANGTSVSSSRASTQTGVALGAMSNNFKHFIQTELASPFLAEETVYESKSMYNNTTTTHLLYVLGGFISTTASADGFTLYPDSGTMTGTIQVYGYRK
jgi:hypothetical protein